MKNIKKTSICTIFSIIAFICGCNQVSNNSGENSDSYLSKKTYEKKFTSWLHPYKIDVQQGNIISKEMMSAVRVGMSKVQVRHVLGTSILTESFERNQWIYAFSNANNGVRDKEHVLILSFKNDKLNDVVENTIINKINSKNS